MGYAENVKSPLIPRLAGLLAVTGLLLGAPASGYRVEMGQVVVADTFVSPIWTTITFVRPFDTRPVVAVLPTTNGSDPMTLRIRNVTTTGFEVVQTEPNANDGLHLQNTTAYIAIEPGNHILPNGNRVIALEHSTTSFANRLISTTWDTVVFPSAFPTAPAIVAQIQTTANETGNPPTTSAIPFMDVGIRNATTGSVQVTLERAESVAGTVVTQERIGIIAIEDNTDLTFVDALGTTAQLQGVLTPVNIQGFSNGCFTNNYPSSFTTVPLAVASQNTRAGNNGGWVRRCSETAAALGLTVDEDVDSDTERNHTNESAGIIAASTAFHANFEVDLLVSKTVVAQSDPVNGATDPKSIPNADVEYTIEVANMGSLSPDVNTLVITDDIPAAVRLCVAVACSAGGPIILDATGSPVPPGVTLGSVEYSNDGGASFAYVPTPDAAGFDAAVNAVRITLNGVMASIAPAGTPSFQLRIAARVN